MTTTEQQIGALQAEMEHVQDDVAEIKRDVREMRDILLQARGGWRMMLTVGTICAVAGGLATKILGWLLPYLTR